MPTKAELLQAAEVLDARSESNEHESEHNIWLNSPERLKGHAASLRSVATLLRTMAEGGGDEDLDWAMIELACAVDVHEEAEAHDQAAILQRAIARISRLPALEKRREELEAQLKESFEDHSDEASRWVLESAEQNARHLRTVQAARDAIRRERERRVRAEEVIMALEQFRAARRAWDFRDTNADPKPLADAVNSALSHIDDARAAWQQTIGRPR